MKVAKIYESPTKFQKMYIHYILFLHTSKTAIVLCHMETEAGIS